jgi:hypothetical protein
MTDATDAVTQSVLEAFTHEYLTGLGAAIRENENRWYVHLPTHIEVTFNEQNEFEIVLSDEEIEGDVSVSVLTPESEFTQQLLDEAAEMATMGQIALTKEMISDDYQYPAWITESSVDVVNETFDPYYDRTAICVFVRIGIETVSEYQTQFLEAVTLDVESKNQLPGVTERLIDEWFTAKAVPPCETARGDTEDDVTISPDKLADMITVGQEIAVKEVREGIDEIRQSASHAAAAEFEEYRQLQEQRINDLQNQINSLSDRLQNVRTDVNRAESQQQRVEALEKRQEFKGKKENVETELEEVLRTKERGHIQKQREIYERHAIEVNTTPIALTLVTYERGEIELKLSQGDQTGSIRAPYAIGAGVTDEVNCDNCHRQLSEENPIHVTMDGSSCHNCL